jgi:hypothetical protein
MKDHISDGLVVELTEGSMELKPLLDYGSACFEGHEPFAFEVQLEDVTILVGHADSKRCR